MHEYSLVAALLKRIEREAQAHSATAVHRISLRIGTLAGVEQTLFSSAFELCRHGTICEQAELVIKTVEARWACRDCNQRLNQGEVLCCPGCGAPARLVAGDEIILDQIEMEVA